MRVWPRVVAVTLLVFAAGGLLMRWSVSLALQRAAVEEVLQRARTIADTAAVPALAREAAAGDEAAMLPALLRAREAGALSALVIGAGGRVLAGADVAAKGTTLRCQSVESAFATGAPAWRLESAGRLLELAVPLNAPGPDELLLGSTEKPRAVLRLTLPLERELARAGRVWRRAAFAVLMVGLGALLTGLLALRAVLRAFDRTVETMQDGVMVVSRHGRILQLNRAALTLLGGRAADWRGRFVAEAIDAGGLLSEALRLGDAVRDLEASAPARGRRRTDVLCAAGPLDPSDPSAGAVVTLKDISARRKLEQLEAEQARESIQREFVANVSHEFRTPIAAIRGFAETLLSGALDDPQNRREFVEIIHHHAGRLSRLVEDLLQLSVLETKEYKDAREPVELPAFCRELAKSVEPLAQKAGLALVVEGEPGLKAVVDKNHLEHVMLNLLKNAVEYNRPGGRVEVTLRAEGRMAHVSVKDEGMGIPPQDLERLFRRFHRSSEAKQRKPEGTGLGLLIVKKIVERHGGDVWAESVHGRGAVFHFTLPRA